MDTLVQSKICTVTSFQSALREALCRLAKRGVRWFYEQGRISGFFFWAPNKLNHRPIQDGMRVKMPFSPRFFVPFHRLEKEQALRSNIGWLLRKNVLLIWAKCFSTWFVKEPKLLDGFGRELDGMRRKRRMFSFAAQGLSIFIDWKMDEKPWWNRHFYSLWKSAWNMCCAKVLLQNISWWEVLLVKSSNSTWA